MAAVDRMIRIYDRVMASGRQRRYYGDSGFFNFGCWDAHPTSQREASEALVDRLLDGISHKSGRILDVACGLGASTERLTHLYAPDMITAINISEAQLETARKRAPGCAFHCMDAARLGFPGNHFDAVICVEAAFHFDTREAFFCEALRVLKPGGSLVLSDMLFRGFAAPLASQGQVPRANLVPDIATYRRQLQAVGFADIDIRDATQACLGGFREHLVRWPASERRAGRMSPATGLLASLLSRIIAGYFGAITKAYLLASARKPATGRP